MSSTILQSRVKEQFRGATKITSDYYPETLYKMFLINAPSLFTIVWSFAKRFVDEKTR